MPRRSFCVSGSEVATKIPLVNVFLTMTVVMLILTLSMESFSDINFGKKIGYESVAASSFVVYTNGTHYTAADSITGKIYYQSRNCTFVVANLISISPESATVIFKAGVYPCDFTVDKKLNILGESRTATVIQGTITFDSTLVNATPASHHALIQNLKMDGQNKIKVGVKYESPVPSVPLITVQNVLIENYIEHGIYFTNASDCLFDNVVVGNCATAIHYTTSHNFGRITNCELLNYHKVGVYTDAQIFLSGTVFSSMQNSPIIADLVLDNAFGTITGCWFENNKNAPFAPCIDMPNTCYRPLTVTGCFFANKGGDIIRSRNAFGVSLIGNFFSQQPDSESGWCVRAVQGVVYWAGNQLDPAFSLTLSPFRLEDGTSVKTIFYP